MKSQFLTSLDCRWLDDEHCEVLQELVYDSAILNLQIRVPAGFVTDFASVPKLPIIYAAFGNRAHHESVIHDWLFYTAITTRKISDKVFLEAMIVRGKSAWIRNGMYWGVRLGSWKAWNDHRKAGHPA